MAENNTPVEQAQPEFVAETVNEEIIQSATDKLHADIRKDLGTVLREYEKAQNEKWKQYEVRQENTMKSYFEQFVKMNPHMSRYATSTKDISGSSRGPSGVGSTPGGSIAEDDMMSTAGSDNLDPSSSTADPLEWMKDAGLETDDAKEEGEISEFEEITEYIKEDFGEPVGPGCANALEKIWNNEAIIGKKIKDTVNDIKIPGDCKFLKVK